MRRPSTRFKRSAAATYLAAAIGVVTFAALAYLAVTAQRGLPVRSYYDVTADFRDAANLGRFSEVRIAGVRVGQVLSLSSHDGVARVRLQLNAGTGPLPADTHAEIRLRTLLGARYVDLTPGRSRRTVPDGGTIPLGQTGTGVDLLVGLQALDATRRRALRATVRTLGAGFATRGPALNRALRDAPPMLGDTSTVARAVDGRPGAAERLFPSLDAFAGAFDPVREDLARGFEPAARALRPFSDRRRAVEAALEVAPGALDDVRQGLAESDPLLAETAGFARAAVAMTRPAPSALRATAALLRDGRRPLVTARVLLSRVGRAIGPTLRMTAAVDPLLEPLTRALVNAEAPARSFGAYGCDALGWWRNWRSMLGAASGGADGPLGPPTMVRMWIDGSAPKSLVSTGPAPSRAGAGVDAYPAPCTASSERLP